MNRRGFLGALVSGAAVAAIATPATPSPEILEHPVGPEVLARLRSCDCGGWHQVDDNEAWLCHDGHATTCPKHPTYNRAFAARLAERDRTRELIDSSLTRRVPELVVDDPRRHGRIASAVRLMLD